MLDIWHVGWGDLKVDKLDPVNIRKPLVLLNVLCSSLKISKALRKINYKEAASLGIKSTIVGIKLIVLIKQCKNHRTIPLDQILGIRIKVSGKANFSSQNLFVQLHVVFVKEWRVAGKHLKNENAKRVPVDRLAIALRLDDFGSKVVGRTAQRPRIVWNNLCKTKIRNFDMPI